MGSGLVPCGPAVWASLAFAHTAGSPSRHTSPRLFSYRVPSGRSTALLRRPAQKNARPALPGDGTYRSLPGKTTAAYASVMLATTWVTAIATVGR
jgi:hypothetical protein